MTADKLPPLPDSVERAMFQSLTRLKASPFAIQHGDDLLAVQEGIDALFDALAAIGDAEPVAYRIRRDGAAKTTAWVDMPMMSMDVDGVRAYGWQVEYAYSTPRPSAALVGLVERLGVAAHDCELAARDDNDVVLHQGDMARVARLLREAIRTLAAPAVAAPVAVGDATWVDLQRGQFGASWHTSDPAGIMPEGRYYFRPDAAQGGSNG